VVKLTAKDLKYNKHENFEITGLITKKWLDAGHAFHKHALAVLKDKTGIVTLNLWNEQVEQVNVGNTVWVKRAYTKNTKGVWQIHTWDEKIEVLPEQITKKS